MKHTIPYPHQRQQILARLLLTIWLPTICSPEIIVAAPPSERPVQHSTNTGASGPSTSAMDSPAQITSIAPGHQVTFRPVVSQNNGVWKAAVGEQSNLPVSIKGDVIHNQDEIKQKLHNVRDRLKKLESRKARDRVYRHFKQYRDHIQKARFLKSLGYKKDASYYQKSAKYCEEPDISLLSLEADWQETLAASSSTSQETGQFLNDEDDIGFYKKRGDDAWREFMDYLTQQGQLNLPIRMSIESLNHLRPDHKDALKNAIKAHDFYVSSCSAAAKKHDLRSEINIRAIMALRLAILGRFLEAKRYALQNIYIMLKDSSASDIKVSDLIKAQALLARVQGAQPAGDDRQTTTSSATSTLNILRELNTPWKCPSFTSTVQEGYSATEKMQIQVALFHDLKYIAQELLDRNVRNLTRPQVPKGKISWHQQRATCYMLAGAIALIVSTLLLAVLVHVLGSDVFFKFFRAYSWRAVFAAATTVMFGVLAQRYGHALWKTGDITMQKSVACSTLNSHIEQALTYYDQKKMKEFLSQIYTMDRCLSIYPTQRDTFEQLFLSKEVNGLSGSWMLTDLLEYGFSPDGIADLFIKKGAALQSVEISTPACKTYDRDQLARDNFSSALDVCFLEKSAQDLDKRVTESPIKRYFQECKDLWLLLEQNSLTPEQLEDGRVLPCKHSWLFRYINVLTNFLTREDRKYAKEIPVTIRLEAVQNVAKMHLAIASMATKNCPEGIKLATKLVKEIRCTISQSGKFYPALSDQLVSMAEFFNI